MTAAPALNRADRHALRGLLDDVMKARHLFVAVNGASVDTSVYDAQITALRKVLGVGGKASGR